MHPSGPQSFSTRLPQRVGHQPAMIERELTADGSVLESPAEVSGVGSVICGGGGAVLPPSPPEALDEVGVAVAVATVAAVGVGVGVSVTLALDDEVGVGVGVDLAPALDVVLAFDVVTPDEAVELESDALTANFEVR